VIYRDLSIVIDLSQLANRTSPVTITLNFQVSSHWKRLEGTGTRPPPVGSCGMVACQGSLYVFGGNDREGNYFNILYQYNIGTVHLLLANQSIELERIEANWIKVQTSNERNTLPWFVFRSK